MTTALELDPGGTVSRSGIPIRNIWYLMAYASNITTKLSAELRSSEEFLDDLPDLVARLLLKETRLRIWGNLTVGYRQKRDELSRLRGSVSHIQTVRRNSFARGKIICKFEEITLDTTENRLVRTALRKIGPLVKDSDLVMKCRGAESLLEARGIGLLPQNVGLGSLGRIPANPRDARMCALSILALQMNIPLQESGSQSLYSPAIDDNWLRTLFQKAVFGFYQHHLSKMEWSVRSGRRLNWETDNSTPGLDSILPSMETDIEIHNQKEGHKTVIDTKFSNILTTGQFGNKTLKSRYIYQLYAYLRSQEDCDDGFSTTSTGMLLHPATGYSLYEETIIQGHRFRFATVDLLGGPAEITTQLLNLILEPQNRV